MLQRRTLSGPRLRSASRQTEERPRAVLVIFRAVPILGPADAAATPTTTTVPLTQATSRRIQQRPKEETKSLAVASKIPISSTLNSFPAADYL